MAQPLTRVTRVSSSAASDLYKSQRLCSTNPKPVSSKQTIINLCTLRDGCRVYIFGDGSTWTTHDFKGNGDNEDMSSGEYEEDGEEDEDEDEDEHIIEKEQETGRGKGQ